MTQAIIASLPINSQFVPGCLEKIIDKKISKVALNIFEKIIDWIFSHIFCPYHSLYQKKMARIHTFPDGITHLYDATKLGVGKIVNNSIFILQKKVLFSANPEMERHFSRDSYTDYVVIKDDEIKGPGYYKITEQEISRPANPNPMKKNWMIHAN